MYKILIADNQWLFYYGIKNLLRNNADFQVIDIAKNHSELNFKLKSGIPDILILDYDTINNFPLEEFPILKQQYPGLKIMVISANKNEETINKILECGISHYLSKDCNAEEFQNALNALIAREEYFSLHVLKIILNNGASGIDEDSKGKLSSTEIEFIRLLAIGMTTTEIAGELSMGFHSVSALRKDVLKRLELKNTSQLLMYAMKNGLIDSQDIV